MSAAAAPETGEGATPEDLRRRVQLLREQLARVVQQRDTLREQVRAARPGAADPSAARQQLAASVAAGFALDLQAGRPLIDAAVGQVRAALRNKLRLEARAFAHALMDDPSTHAVGALCAALHAHSDAFYALAQDLFARAGEVAALRHAFAETLDTLLEADLPAGRQRVRELLATPQAASAEAWLAVAGALMSRGEFALAEAVVQVVVQRCDELGDPERLRADWLHAKLIRRSHNHTAGPAAAAPGAVRLALIDYKMPDYDRVSSNVGDYVQTLAFVSNLVRHTGFEFSSAEAGLAERLVALRERLAPADRIDGPRSRVSLELVDRDSSGSRSYAEPTWLIAFGWYMHPSFKRHFEFPFAPNLRPIFVSFHANNREFLTADAVAYLQRHQPIGCRDWTTVYLLREFGVEAFFSGCLTTTIGRLFAAPAPASGARRRTALVDYRPESGEFAGDDVDRFAHETVDVRRGSFVDNLDAALQLLEGYRGYDRIATARLHCYLPCRSMGLDVKFKPRRASDIRFEGLVDLDDDAFLAVRQGLEHKLATMLAAIASGAAEAEVYATWRALCRADVAFADTYCRRYPALPALPFDVAEAAARLRGQALRSAALAPADRPRIELAFAVDQNLAEELPVVLESALAHTRGLLRAHVMTRGLPRAYAQRLEREFGARAEFAVYDFDAIGYGDRLRMLAHTTVSTMDRLLLPELLIDAAKVIYLDVDIVVLGDLAPLWAVDLGTHALAGRSSPVRDWQFGHHLAYRAAASLAPRDAWALRRRLYAEGPLGFRAFNAGVVVMNLARMRADDFSRQYLPLIIGAGMNDQDALNMYARADRLELGVEWNAVPSLDATEGARIVHFAGPVKPWSALYITRRADFERYRRAYLARTRDVALAPP